jgi:hypothetical protein
MPSSSWSKAATVATAAAAGNAAAAAGHMHRWEEWSGAVRKRVAAQAAGKTYRSYLRQGEAVAADRTTRPSAGADRSPSPTTRSYIAQGDSLRDMVAKDAPRSLLGREHEGELSATEAAHIQSVAHVLTALFGGRLSASQYRQGISIVVAFLLTVARSSAKESGSDAIGQAQVARDESRVFWLVCAVVEDVYPLMLDSQLLLAETALTWQLLRQRLPEVADHLSTLFGDMEAAEAGFGGLFVTKFLQTLCADQFLHETTCQIWDILLVSHFFTSSELVTELEPEPEPQPEHGASAEHPVAKPFAAVYACISPTTVSATLHAQTRRGTVMELEPGSIVEVVEQCAVPSLGCVRLRVCAVATAVGNARRTDEQTGVHFVHQDCGGWITKPGTETLRDSTCFAELKREATCAMLPQVVLAFIAMHSAAILDTDDLSQLLGMGGDSVLAKCKDETRSVGAIVRAAHCLGLSEVTIIAHRLHCRAECLAIAEATAAEWARARRVERLATQAQAQAQPLDDSAAEQDSTFTLLPVDSYAGSQDGFERDSATENPMVATVRWFMRSATGPGDGMMAHHRDGHPFSQSSGGSIASVEATACIALFSGSLQLGSRDHDGPANLVHVDESKCLAGCLGRGQHHIKCPNYELAYQRELQLKHWRKTNRTVAADSSSSTRPQEPSRNALKVVAAIPPSAASPSGLHGGERRYKGKAVVILRGGVDFMTKQRHAAAAGAAAVIFVNLEEDAPFLAFPPLDGGDMEGSYPNIPAVCVGRSDGEALLAAVQAPISPLESGAAETTSTNSISSLSSPSGSVDDGDTGTGGVWVDIQPQANQEAVERWQQVTIHKARLQRQS